MKHSRPLVCQDPEKCRADGRWHGERGLMAMTRRCDSWSLGWREGKDNPIEGDE